MTYIVAAAVTAVACVAISRGSDRAMPMASPIQDMPRPVAEGTVFAQAINVVEVHAGQPTTREFIVQSKQALAENHRRIHGVPPDAR